MYNAIEHAYAEGEGTIKLRIEEDRETLRIVVEDIGAWREPLPSDERGRGILLMQHLMDSAQIETTSHGTKVTLELRAGSGRERTLAPAPASPGR